MDGDSDKPDDSQEERRLLKSRHGLTPGHVNATHLIKCMCDESNNATQGCRISTLIGESCGSTRPCPGRYHGGDRRQCLAFWILSRTTPMSSMPPGSVKRSRNSGLRIRGQGRAGAGRGPLRGEFSVAWLEGRAEAGGRGTVLEPSVQPWCLDVLCPSDHELCRLLGRSRTQLDRTHRGLLSRARRGRLRVSETHDSRSCLLERALTRARSPGGRADGSRSARARSRGLPRHNGAERADCMAEPRSMLGEIGWLAATVVLRLKGMPAWIYLVALLRAWFPSGARRSGVCSRGGQVPMLLASSLATRSGRLSCWNWRKAGPHPGPSG